MRHHDTPLHPGINFSKVPVGGWPGLLLTVAVMAMFLVTLPDVRWFFIRALPLGILVGGILVLFHRR